jgi:predicted RNase H-like nuclease (RuvC/YqgF family)
MQKFVIQAQVQKKKERADEIQNLKKRLQKQKGENTQAAMASTRQLKIADTQNRQLEKKLDNATRKIDRLEHHVLHLKMQKSKKMRKTRKSKAAKGKTRKSATNQSARPKIMIKKSRK